MPRYSRGLMYEWTFNKNFVDTVQCVPLTSSGSVVFVNETSTTSSVYVSSGGYMFAPNGVYFQNVFTLTTWFYPVQFNTNARVLDFGCGSYSWNVILCYCRGGSQTPFFETYSGGASKGQLQTPNTLSVNKWVHLAVSLDSLNRAYLYINGSLVQTYQANAGTLVTTRTQNYIGKSNWNDGQTFARFRNLRIYNFALNASQITDDMIN